MKNINRTLSILAQITRIGLIIVLAIEGSRGIWWLTNPLGYTAIYDKAQNARFSQQKPEIIAQGITNRAPFGMVSEQKEVAPVVSDQIKLVGVYASSPKRSVAFLQVNGKNMIAQIGDRVSDNTLTAVHDDNIVLTNSNNQTMTIRLSGAQGGSSTSDYASNRPASPPPYPASNNDSNEQASSANQRNDNDNNNDNASPSSNNQGENDHETLAEKRRKLIERFQQNAAD